MKLWQGWHNTDLDRSYFHYGPLGGTKKQMGILAQTCKKRGVKIVKSVVQNGKLWVAEPRSLIKIPQSLIKMP